MNDMFLEIPILPASGGLIQRYKSLVFGDWKAINGLMKKGMKNRTIIHVNSTSCGGGVAEILKSQVALEKSLGLNSHWLVIKAPARFFVITKKIHNLIQGASGGLTKEEKDFYLEVNNKIGKSFNNYCRQFASPVVVIHDPQPMPLISFIPEDAFPILRLHIDLSHPNISIMNFLRPFISKYFSVIVSSSNYCRAIPWIKKSKIKIIMPAIDPFTEKNATMKAQLAKSIIQELGVNPTKPIMTQVSRFDLWKDPLGVIKAYYLVKNEIPELQLVLAGLFQAKDDPEAISMFEHVKKHAHGDPDIHLFSDPDKLQDISNDVFINALDTASSVIIQNSSREGFGLTMTEAMWKGKPLIARISSGALLQIKNNRNGILISSPEQIAESTIRLFKNKKFRDRLGVAAKKSVQKNFLMMHFVLNNLKCYIASMK